MELIKRVENISIETADEEIYFDFEIGGMPYYLRLIRDETWKPLEICHWWSNRKGCEICKKNVEKNSVCAEFSDPEYLYVFFKKLQNHPNVRLKILLLGIVF